jgi:hypothetical protein
MNLKKTISAALLLAIGMILHQITPPFILGMKPDFSLAMMFIAIVLSDDFKMTLIIGIVAGIFAAATTTFPGGQIPNIIDKLITSQLVFFLFRTMKDKFNKQIVMVIISIVGTLISGTIFLATALFLFGLPAPFKVLLLTVIIPATVINTFAASILYKAVSLGLKYSRS